MAVSKILGSSMTESTCSKVACLGDGTSLIMISVNDFCWVFTYFSEDIGMATFETYGSVININKSEKNMLEIATIHLYRIHVSAGN